MKKAKVTLNILAVISFLFGALYCFTLVFIPIGVYCFTAGKLFSYKAEHMLDSYTADKKTLTRYFIFVAIACFPLGLVSGLAYLFLYGNNVKVEELNYIKITDVSPEEKQASTEAETEVKEEVKEESKEEPKEEKPQEETEEEKLEKLAKLENFKKKGIISEEEFEMAKEQMFGKKED